jgi:hypothetical protein
MESNERSLADPAASSARTPSRHRFRTRPLELVAEKRLERTPAARALPRAPLRPKNPGRRHGYPLVRERSLQAVATLTMSDAADDHGVDVEPEAEREHNGDGSAAG